MSKEKLVAAAQAAGFAMVNPDDAVTRDAPLAKAPSILIGQSADTATVQASPADTASISRSVFGGEWFDFFGRRSPT